MTLVDSNSRRWSSTYRQPSGSWQHDHAVPGGRSAHGNRETRTPLGGNHIYGDGSGQWVLGATVATAAQLDRRGHGTCSGSR